MEVLEISLQIYSLTTSATTSNVDEVSLSAWIIAANFIVLPLAIMLGPWLCSSSPDASSHHSMMATIMLVEVLFDKLYVAVGVLLRAHTMTDQTLDLMGQLTVHGALLLPALMTFLDVQDALDLSDHMDRLLQATAGDKKRSTFMRNISSKIGQVTSHSVFILMQRVGLVVSILMGLAFGTYTQYVAVTAKLQCEERIGSIAKCADQRNYFANGFFHATTCGFDRVKKFECAAEGEKALDPGTRKLPNAEEEYASMSSLTDIIMHNSLLESAPTGWARVPSELMIDLTNSNQLSDLPFVLCASGTNLTKIKLDGTSAGRVLNWTGQLRRANLSVNSNYLNVACREELEALPDFTTLLLGDNELRDEDLKDGGRFALSSFEKLTHLDVGNNDLAVVKIDIVDKVYRPIVERFVENNVGSGVSISFAGNSLVRWHVLAAGKEYREELANVLLTCTAVANDLQVMASDWGDSEMDKLALLLPDLNVNYLELNSNLFGDKGLKAIAAALPSSKVTQLELYYNQIGVEGANALAEALQKSTVTWIDLGYNKIGDEGAKAIAEALNNSQVTRIELSSNQIGNAGASAIARFLNRSKVTWIELFSNNIGDEGAKALAKALPSSDVTVIHLHNNQIGDEGAKAIAAALPSSKVTVIYLDNNNHIGDEGVNKCITGSQWWT